MTETFQILILLLAVISLVGVIAKRLQIPAAILLVITGVGLALIPGLPSLQLAPDLVLLLVLPPIIYWDAVKMSWKEFRFNLRPIALLAIGCVVFTTVAVAAATHFLLGFPWAVGFVLGAIVSPPDAVAPLAIAQRMQLPRRLVVVLEGEGLANDATALVLYRFAVMAVSAGSFSFVDGCRQLYGDRCRGGRLGNWRRLALASPAPLGPRSRHRDHALDPDAVRGLLAAGATRRLRRARHIGDRALCQLERLALDSRCDPASGRGVLGFPDLSDRGHGVPHHRPAGADTAPLDSPLYACGNRHGGCCGLRGRHRGSLHLDVSGDLPAALALPCDPAP